MHFRHYCDQPSRLLKAVERICLGFLSLRNNWVCSAKSLYVSFAWQQHFHRRGMSSLGLILASFLLRGFSMIWNQIPPARQTDSLRRRTGHPPEGTVSLGPLFLPNDHCAHFLGVLGLGIWGRF